MKLNAPFSLYILFIEESVKNKEFITKNNEKMKKIN